MKGILKALGVLALAPLIMGGGGINPPPPSATKIEGPAISGTVVMDPHEPLVTTNAKRATMTLRKGSETASAVFDAPEVFSLFCGCDLALNDTRFVNKPLVSFVPQQLIDQLLTELGIAVPLPEGVVPIITDIANGACTADPANPADVLDPNGDLTLRASADVCSVPGATFSGYPPIAGVLSMDIVVQFRVPSRRNNAP